MSRTFINFQYSMFFDLYFHSEVKMAAFIGFYTSISLVVTLIIQMLLLSRLIQFIGLKGTHLLYNMMLFGVVTSFFANH